MTTTAALSPEALRRAYADHLAEARALRDPAWHAAFATVPREAFVPRFAVRTPGGLENHRGDDPAALPTVYSDASLITQWNAHGTATSSSSQPTVMAAMLEALDLTDGDRVLEIGTGTGYNAALMCHRLGDDRVHSIDIDPQLVDAARAALHNAGHAPHLTVGDGMQGWPAHAPYDALIATCGINRLPDPWRQQVRPGGRIVANIGLGLVRLVVGLDHTAAGRFLPVSAAFMAARPGGTPLAPPAAQRTAELVHATGRTRTITLPVDLTDLMPQHLGRLAHPDVEELLLTGADCRTVRYLVHQPSGSWARITPGGDNAARLDHGGPRDLWAEREPLLAGWVHAGQPGIDRYQLHIGPDSSHQLQLGDAAWTL